MMAMDVWPGVMIGALLLCGAGLFLLGLKIGSFAKMNESGERAEERVRMVIESVPSAILMADAGGRIVLVNAQAEAIFGYSRLELLGGSIEMLIPARFCGHHCAMREGYQADPIARKMGSGRELFGKRKDGSEIPIEIGLNPVPTSEGRFVLASVIDITDRKRAERESALLQQELSHLARISTLGELAGTLAHELNQPLAAILGNAQTGSRILKNGMCNAEEIAEILVDIAADAKRAGGIIHGMRAMLRRESTSEVSILNLNEIVTQSLGLLHGEISARRIEIHLRLDATLLPVRAGRVELQQVFINLVINGLDAMKESHRQGALTISTSNHEGGVVVSVHDSGTGIAPEAQARMFDAFYSTKSAGLGLGLSISRGIMERFGGELRAENHPAGGAVFEMVLSAVS